MPLSWPIALPTKSSRYHSRAWALSMCLYPAARAASTACCVSSPSPAVPKPTMGIMCPELRCSARGTLYLDPVGQAVPAAQLAGQRHEAGILVALASLGPAGAVGIVILAVEQLQRLQRLPKHCGAQCAPSRLLLPHGLQASLLLKHLLLLRIALLLRVLPRLLLLQLLLAPQLLVAHAAQPAALPAEGLHVCTPGCRCTGPQRPSAGTAC